MPDWFGMLLLTEVGEVDRASRSGTSHPLFRPIHWEFPGFAGGAVSVGQILKHAFSRVCLQQPEDRQPEIGNNEC
jgi:hypothetical protein